MSNLFSRAFNRVRLNINIVIMLFIFWLILFEKITVATVIVGIIASIASILFTDLFLLKGIYDREYMIGLWPMTKYMFILVYEIYMAGIGVIPNILSGKSNTGYVTCQTLLEDDFLIDILANSVTLTPGTVTVDKQGQTLRILALDLPEDDPREALPLNLEKVLLEFEQNRKAKEAG